MSAQHRATRQQPQRGGRRVAPRSTPRYGRIAALGSAFVITGITVAAGMGVFPTDSGRTAYAATRGPSPASAKIALSSVTGEGVGAVASVSGEIATPGKNDPTSTALPEGTGTGKRVVFDQSDQRVWLVDDSGQVERTYLVSGSVTDNLNPGTYAVYSRSRWAVGLDESGVMQYFVRFTKGDNAAIGFHTIPTKNGEPLQRKAKLGTPQSHGCIRQATTDAVALWNFAPDGTPVVVAA